MLAGYARLLSATTAAQADWANVLYPVQGQQTLGQLLANALSTFAAPVVAAIDAGHGRFFVSTDSGVQAALLALPPTIAALCTPRLVYGQSASQWDLVSDSWYYGGNILPSMCLPQLAKRTAAAFVQKALAADAFSGFAVVSQLDGGKVWLWSDFDGSAYAACAALTLAGASVATEFFGAHTQLPFEGGTT